MSTQRKKAIPEPAPTATTLVVRIKPGQTPAEGNAGLVVAGLASNSATARDWSTFAGEVDVTACLSGIVHAAARVNRGDLGDLEAILTAQAITLNSLFTNLSHRARSSAQLDHFERYLRLALRSQSMCRATCETLAVLKNPPVFARQANIAHGPQQVNNALGPTAEGPARVGSGVSVPNKLLTESEAHGERMDSGTASTASARDPALAAVGTVHGPADGRGEGPIGQERGPRRC